MESVPLDWIARVGDWPGSSEYRLDLVTFLDKRSDTTQILRYDVYLSRARLVMAAQTTLGVPLYESVLGNGELTVSRRSEHLQEMPLDRALADFLLATWPLEQVAAALHPSGYTIVKDGETRRLLRPDGMVEVEIYRTVQDDRRPILRIVHHDVPLEVIIQTVEQQSLSP
jgi:hypothetical protein